MKTACLFSACSCIALNMYLFGESLPSSQKCDQEHLQDQNCGMAGVKRKQGIIAGQIKGSHGSVFFLSSNKRMRHSC